MDDRVQQCPNCGAAVLPSARFCVTCGIRLPESPAGTASGDTGPSGWSQPAEDVWIGEAPALDDESEQRLAEDFQHDQHPVTDEAGSTERGESKNREPNASSTEDAVIALPPADHDARLESASMENPDAEAAALVDTGSETSDQPAVATYDGRSSDVEAVRPRGDEPEPELEPAIDDQPGQPGQPGDDPGAEQVGPEGELTDLVFGPADTDTALDATAWPIATDREASSPSPDREPAHSSPEPDDFEPAGWDDLDDGADEMSQPASGEMDGTDEVTSDITGEMGSDLERAIGLLEELRTLLPRLTAPVTPPTSTPDLAALRERALAARGDRSFDDFAALRDVVNDLVNRPRDIEVVLRLSQRVDDIDALLKERDRLDAALSDLIDGLDQ